MPGNDDIANNEEEKLQEMTDLLEQFSQKPVAFQNNRHSEEEQMFSQMSHGNPSTSNLNDEDAELAAAIAASLEQH